MTWLFELLCLALMVGAIFRALSLGHCLTSRERATITGIAAAALYGLWKPISGWQPDEVHFFLALAAGAYLMATTQVAAESCSLDHSGA